MAKKGKPGTKLEAKLETVKDKLMRSKILSPGRVVGEKPM